MTPSHDSVDDESQGVGTSRGASAAASRVPPAPPVVPDDSDPHGTAGGAGGERDGDGAAAVRADWATTTFDDDPMHLATQPVRVHCRPAQRQVLLPEATQPTNHSVQTV